MSIQRTTLTDDRWQQADDEDDGQTLEDDRVVEPGDFDVDLRDGLSGALEGQEVPNQL